MKRHSWMQVLRSPNVQYPVGTMRWWCLWCERTEDVMAPYPPIEDGCKYSANE